MVFLVAMSNNARDEALDGERHAYDVTLLTRTLDASIARAEAALGRFVLDEDVKTSGNIYYQPVAARRAADQPARALLARRARRSAQRVDELQQLYQQARRGIRARRPRRPSPGSGAGGTSYYYAAAPVADRPGAAQACSAKSPTPSGPR